MHKIKIKNIECAIHIINIMTMIKSIVEYDNLINKCENKK